MPPPSGISFLVKIPIEPATGKGVFFKWLQKHGQLQAETRSPPLIEFTFDAKKFVRKDNLHASLRTAFVKNGLQGGDVHMDTLKIPGPREPTIAELVQQAMAVERNQIATELQELRLLAEREIPPTIINNNNNVIILNFGCEDMSFLQPQRWYLERAFQGLSELVKDIYFNANQPQNHVIRINVPLCSAEVCMNGNWTKIDLPEATTKMISKSLGKSV